MNDKVSLHEQMLLCYCCDTANAEQQGATFTASASTFSSPDIQSKYQIGDLIYLEHRWYEYGSCYYTVWPVHAVGKLIYLKFEMNILFIDR